MPNAHVIELSSLRFAQHRAAHFVDFAACGFDDLDAFVLEHLLAMLQPGHNGALRVLHFRADIVNFANVMSAGRCRCT